jgi:hypothetical protein
MSSQKPTNPATGFVAKYPPEALEDMPKSVKIPKCKLCGKIYLTCKCGGSEDLEK